MDLFGNGVRRRMVIGTNEPSALKTARSGSGLRAVAVALLGFTTAMPGFSQQNPPPEDPSQQSKQQLKQGSKQAAPKPNDKVLNDLPVEPVPTPTQPLYLRSTARDFSKPYGRLWGNPIKPYTPTKIENSSFSNSVRLGDLVKDGKIYLSLSDAIALALENNYDIAIARYDLDIADTDILRAKAGGPSGLLGAPSGLVTGTLSGGSSSTLSTGGGPGGTSVGSGGAGSGSSGLSLTANGAGPSPEPFDPVVTGALQYDRSTTPVTNFFTGGTAITKTFDFTYNQGFAPGTALTVGFNNSTQTNTNLVASFSPLLNSNFRATVTQHLLQGAGIWVNHRFIYQAINDRRITDSSFRQQLLYTVNQVENIYWNLVSAYEDLQAKEAGY